MLKGPIQKDEVCRCILRPFGLLRDYKSFESSTSFAYSNMSPGWQWSILQIASRVENRIVLD